MKPILLFFCSLMLVSAQSQWTPPMGIPEPPFGIKENVHSLYGADSGATYDYEDDGATGPVPYRLTAKGDPYTYYIDPSHPSSTDVDNIHGTTTTPRKTLPTASFGPVVLQSGIEIAGVRLKPGSVVHIANTQAGVSWTFGFTGGWNNTLKATVAGSIGIGTAEKPIFIRGADPENYARVLLNTGQEMPNTEYVVFENLFFDGGNHGVPYPFTYNGGNPSPADPYDAPDATGHRKLQLSTGSNCVAFRKCEFSGSKFYDFRYITMKGHALEIAMAGPRVGIDSLKNIVLLQCKIGPNGAGAMLGDPHLNIAEGYEWKGPLPLAPDGSSYAGKTYPYKEEVALIGLNIGNGVENIWVLDSEMFQNGDSIQIGEISTKPGYLYPPRRIYIGRNNFRDDQENNVDIKGGMYVVISENSFRGVHKAKNTIDGLPYIKGVSTTIKGGGNGEALRINDEGINGYVWIVNNTFKDCTNAITRGKNKFTFADPDTWGAVYVIGNLITGIDRDPLWFPLGRDDALGKPGEGYDGEGYAYYGAYTGEFWFVNNTIDRTGRGVTNYHGGHMHIFNNIITNRLYSNDGIERDYHDIRYWHHAQVPVENYQKTFSQNIVWPKFNGHGNFTPKLVDPMYAGKQERSTLDHYTLNLSSPAIDAGIDPQILYDKFEAQFGIPLPKKDLKGHSRPQGGSWDIGALEMTYSATPPSGVSPSSPKRTRVE
jgi:hypothetical protein